MMFLIYWRKALVTLIIYITFTALSIFGNRADAFYLVMETVHLPDIGIKIEIPMLWEEKIPMNTQKLGEQEMSSIAFGTDPETEREYSIYDDGDSFGEWCMISVIKGFEAEDGLPLVGFKDILLKSFGHAEVIDDNLVKVTEHNREIGYALQAIGRQVVPDGVVNIIRWVFLKDFKKTGNKSAYTLTCSAAKGSFDDYRRIVFTRMLTSVHFTEGDK